MHNNASVTVGPHELLVLIPSRYLVISYFYVTAIDDSYTLTYNLSSRNHFYLSYMRETPSLLMWQWPV